VPASQLYVTELHVALTYFLWEPPSTQTQPAVHVVLPLPDVTHWPLLHVSPLAVLHVRMNLEPSVLVQSIWDGDADLQVHAAPWVELVLQTPFKHP